MDSLRLPPSEHSPPFELSPPFMGSRAPPSKHSDQSLEQTSPSSFDADSRSSIAPSVHRDTIVLTWQGHDVLFSIPEDLKFLALRVRDEFLQKLSALSPGEGDLASTSFTSKLHLASAFLEHVSQTHPDLRDATRTAREKLLEAFLDDFERDYLALNDIHVRAAESADDEHTQLRIIGSYYSACAASQRPDAPRESSLLKLGTSDKVNIFAILGGQGTNKRYLDELRHVFTTYHHYIVDFIVSLSDLLEGLSSQPQFRRFFPQGLSLLKWLMHAQSAPSTDYLGSAPVSFPIIGVLQLVHYVVSLKVLGLSPFQFQRSLSGVTGHSQGIVIAAVISGADTWSSLHTLSHTAIRTLFSIGLRGQQHYPTISLDPTIEQDSLDMGEGHPTSMLSIKGASHAQVLVHIDAVNHHLPESERISISLYNGPRNFVVSGPALSLYGLNVRLRQYKVSPETDQARILFRERKLEISNQFLPIAVPFHNDNMKGAVDAVLEDLKETLIMSNELRIPLYDTNTGKDICLSKVENIVPRLVRLILVDPVHWEDATEFPNASHILDFGPGGSSSIANMTSQNKAGTGARLISACNITEILGSVGCKAELFNQFDGSLQYEECWMNKFAPRLAKDSTGNTFVDTKMGRLLSLPPIMVPGMTPTTVASEFVIATMNAGYHIELGGGGYFRENALESALEKISAGVSSGRGITVNLIYANSRAIQWQIPLLTRLCKAGIPIDGLTIGAGVPSIEVMQGYIHDLGLKHVSLKPGSVSAIEAVIEVAKAHSTFPIMLQWTGGRAGGHHSFEDFHEPMLQMYGRIRQCSNIVLVAGSGFGGSDDVYPYLTGSWSKAYGYPPMPFDGALFGSRMMTAKEALTSTGAKQAIVKTPGVDDTQWDKTYKSPTGGVLTVISAMGEPIHMLATRGVKLWAEMDAIFKLDKNKRLGALVKKRSHIIKKLNADYHRVWFGQKNGSAAEVEEMTYLEFIVRIVDLMYLKSELRWIDPSWKLFTFDFIRRVEERFASVGAVPVLHETSELDDPYAVIERIAKNYGPIQHQLITALDIQFFHHLCIRPKQKPVPFIPAIDENFEFHFKTDSLWQSEDLSAVIEGDIERTCVLHGPLAAQHSKTFDEPVKDILDNINNGLIARLQADVYENDLERIPVLEYFGGEEKTVDPELFSGSITIKRVLDTVTYELSSSPDVELPPAEAWFVILMGAQKSWRRALLESEYLISDFKKQRNPIRSICHPAHGLSVTILNSSNPLTTRMIVKEDTRISERPTAVEIRLESKDQIAVNLWHSAVPDTKLEHLTFRFSYHPDAGYAPIREITNSRVDNLLSFYHRLWFAHEKFDLDQSVTQTFSAGTARITKQSIMEFSQTIGNKNQAYLDRPDESTFAPLDYAAVLAWKALLKPVLLKAIGGDILNLVHLSNTFKMVPGAEPLKAGDRVEASSTINSVLIQDSGKTIQVCATIRRENKPVVSVISTFMYRGIYTDFENTFEHQDEKPIQVQLRTARDVAILRSKDWIQFNTKDLDLLGKTLTFFPKTLLRYKNKTVFSSVQVHGRILVKPDEDVSFQVGDNGYIGDIVYSAGESHGNPVIHYLQKYGTSEEQTLSLKSRIPLHSQNGFSFTTPQSATAYAQASGDFNPIHVSSIFASLANLPGVIHHGMYTSGAVRSLIENCVAKNDHRAFHSFTASFVGMVRPGDEIEVEIFHTGMIAGRRIIEVQARNKVSGETVLVGEAEVEQPPTAYLFTGQGSQEQGMGMDLYESSAVARAVWDRADAYYLDNYGFAITNIVRNNPKELTVFFGGVQGRRIRDNYMAMTVPGLDKDGNTITKCIFKDIHKNSQFYTYRAPKGLLFATQFTQPALTLLELARMKDMEAKGLIASGCSFAGHSLGEFPALAAFANIMTVEQVIAVVFFRGLAMHDTVPRDENGASNFSMCAVNPSRVSKFFDEQALCDVVKKIVDSTGMLLEVVNYNISNRQYVCAGELRALDCLTGIVAYVASNKIQFQWLHTRAEEEESKLLFNIRKIAALSVDKPSPIVLTPGLGVVPLAGIDVPFHSTFLRAGIANFRKFLHKQIDPIKTNPEALIDRWIPNLIGRPFSLQRDYVEDVFKRTNSTAIGKILASY